MLILSVSLSLCLSLYVSLSSSLSLSPPFPLSISLFLSLSIYIYIYLSLALSLFLSLFPLSPLYIFPPSLPSRPPSFSLSLSLSLSLSSIYLSLTLSLSHQAFESYISCKITYSTRHLHYSTVNNKTRSLPAADFFSNCLFQIIVTFSHDW